MTAEPQQPSLRHAANRDFLKAPTECGCCSRDLCIITTLFVGCKHGGRSKNVSSNFDPFVIFPDGGRPPPRQKPSPGRFTFGGGGSKVIDTSPRTPRSFPPYSTEVKIVHCPTHSIVRKLSPRSLQMFVINLHLRSIFPCRNCSK